MPKIEAVQFLKKKNIFPLICMEFKCRSKVTYFLHEIPFASIIMKEMIINDEIGFFLKYCFLSHFLLFSMPALRSRQQQMLAAGGP